MTPPKTFKEVMQEKAVFECGRHEFNIDDDPKLSKALYLNRKWGYEQGFRDCAKWLLEHEAVKTMQGFHVSGGFMEREQLVEALEQFEQLKAEVEGE